MDNFVVSALKYRPQTFKDVVGQSAITTTLEKAIENNHLAQALLFTGPRGVGKTSCARILAKLINSKGSVETNEDYAFNIFELDASLRQYFQDDQKIDIELVPQAIRKELISTVLTKCNFNVSQASIYLGMKRPRLYQLIEALNIPMEKRSYQTKKK